MIDFDLYNDVASEFARDYQFTRFVVTIVTGREVRTPQTPQTITCYIHPASSQDIRDVTRDGYHIEDMIKIFAPVDVDILKDDYVSYRNNNYRIMKENIKVVGDFSKFFGELVVD